MNFIDVCCTFLRLFGLLDANPIKMKGRLSSKGDGGVAGHYQSTMYKMKNTFYRSIELFQPGGMQWLSNRNKFRRNFLSLIYVKLPGNADRIVLW